MAELWDFRELPNVLEDAVTLKLNSCVFFHVKCSHLQD